MGFLVLAIPLELDGIHGVPAVGMCSVVFKSSGLGGCQTPILFFWAGGFAKHQLKGWKKWLGIPSNARSAARSQRSEGRALKLLSQLQEQALKLRVSARRDSSLGNV